MLTIDKLQRQKTELEELRDDEDRRRKAAELKKVLDDLLITDAELPFCKHLIADFQLGYSTAESLRGTLQLMLENHRDQFFLQSRLPEMRRCSLCNTVHIAVYPNRPQDCRMRVEWEKPNPRRMTRDQAFAELGLKPNSTIAQIKSAYKTQAKLRHPDTKTGSTEAMVRLNLVYRTLTKE